MNGKLAVTAFSILALIVGFAVYRNHSGAAAGTEPERVRDCLRATGRRATVETSSTGQRQVALAHGPVQIEQHVTLENSTTYVSFMGSAKEAAWWADQLRQAPEIPDDSVVASGSAFVQYGVGVNAADRAAVASCLAG